MADTEAGAIEFIPPYTAFETFRNQFVRLQGKPVPPRLDRSMFLGMAGGTQSQILAAMRSFRLIGDQGEVNENFVLMTHSEEALKHGMGELLRRFYSDQLHLSERKGTAAQLEESFRSYGVSGSTLRKAVSFFLNMAKYSEVELSPYFRPPQQRVTGKRRAAPRPVVAPQSSAPQTPPAGPAGDSYTVDLRSGGQVVLSCSVNIFRLDAQDREFVFNLIDRLRSYQEADPPVETSLEA